MSTRSLCFLVGWSLLAGFLPERLQAGNPSEDTVRGRAEFFLQYRMSITITKEFPTRGQLLQPERHHKNLEEEPQYRSAEPLYFTVRLGAKAEPYTLVLDHSKGQNWGYDTLYADTDRSGRIRADQKFTGLPDNRGIRFGPVKFMIDCGVEKCPQWFLFHLLEYEPKDGPIRRLLNVNNAGYYAGQVRFGDQKRLVAVVDSDGNGLYNDLFQSFDHAGDSLWIDRNGESKLDGRYRGEESQPLGRYVQVGDRYWQLEVSPDGSAVTIEPLRVPLGVLRATVKDYTLLLLGDPGVIRVRSTQGTANLPAGKYRLVQFDYTLTDHSGKRWSFSGQGGEQGSIIEVPARGEVKLPFGPPLTPKVLCSPSGDELTLSLQLRGSGGETYYDVRSGDDRPPVPKVRILDANDRELAMLDFHYG